MPEPRLPCDAPTCEHYLRSELTAEEALAFESHLDECESCRETLERAAAAPTTWTDARRYLSDSLPEFVAPSQLQPDADSAPDAEDAPPRLSEHDLRRYMAPSDDPSMIGRLGPYEIIGVVGHGGMGVVLKGLDPALRRLVAIKVLAPHLATVSAARQRFAREAQAAAAVVHENIIAIHGVDQWRELPYLVMPYLRGESLQRRIDRLGPLSTKELLRVSLQAANGLAAAHGQGLIHRDVKPANMLLDDGVERLTLTDFGLARAIDDASVTRTGYIAGTPQYMSPEQARGWALDPRSDLFSLGAVMYAMATGRPPFRGSSSYAILRRVVDEDPTPLDQVNSDTPPWLCEIIHRLLAKDPSERFPTADEAARLMRLGLSQQQTPPATTSPELESLSRGWRRRKTEMREAPAEKPKPSGRSRLLVQRLGWVALAVVAALMLFAASFYPRRHLPEQEAAGAAATEPWTETVDLMLRRSAATIADDLDRLEQALLNELAVPPPRRDDGDNSD